MSNAYPSYYSRDHKTPTEQGVTTAGRTALRLPPSLFHIPETQRKIEMKTAALLTAITLTACAASTGVVSIGIDTYSISQRDNGPMASLGALKAAAYKDAAAFCAGKNKALQILRSNDVPRSFGQFPETEVQFSCV